MEYREWKELMKKCLNKGDGIQGGKASSRGKCKAQCRVTGKRCQMSGCPLNG